VLIARNRSSFRGRAFDATDEATLATQLQRASGLPTVLYTGEQSLADTIALFARADVVVGIHGAGLTNTIFTPHRVCVVELSSWVDKAHKTRWRTSGDYVGRTDSAVPRWNHLIAWQVHRLTPEQIVASYSQEKQRHFWSDAPDPSMLNEKREPVKPNRKQDLMLLDAPIFKLTPQDIDAIAAHVVACQRQSRSSISHTTERSDGVRVSGWESEM
jgi:hypothetical protein